MSRFVATILLLAWFLIPPAMAAAGTVEKIEVQGLFRMSPQSFLRALEIEEGDPYDPDRVRKQFKRLWDLRVFEDIRIEVETGEGGGTVLVVKVKERPILTAVTYQDVRMLTRTDIEDRLKQRGFTMRLGQAIDPGNIYLAEGLIRDMLAEKGFLDAKVESEIRRVTESSRAVHFFIDAGGKTRIQKIEFTGNDLFRDKRLRGTLSLTQERKWWWPWSKKNLYHPGKWDQDITSIRALYQNHGYLDVELRPPVIEVKETKKEKKQAEPVPSPADGTAEAPSDPKLVKIRREMDELDERLADSSLPPKKRENLTEKRLNQEERYRKAAKKSQKKKRWVFLTVQVGEGRQYRLGEINFTGNEAFPEEALRAMIPLREEAILQNNLLEAGVERISRLYEDLGRLYATVVRRIQRRPDEDVADIEIAVDEDQPYYVGRLEFAGNTATHDKVLRREMLLMEGELFNRSKLDLSRAKVNQLGYFQVPGEPIIEPVEGENLVNIRLPGLEQGRNEIQVGGGYSGVDGAFFNGVYSTRNFLGRGQILSVALQIGGRSNRYQISFREPWFLGKPYTFGFSLFKRDIDYGATLNSSSSGGGLVFGRRLGRFAGFNIAYNYESVESTTFLTPAPGFGEPSSIKTENDVSSITPIFTFDTINNPYRPTRGKSLRVSAQVAGGPLGGNTNFIKPIITFTGYRKALRKSYFGLHSQIGAVREWSGGSDLVNNSDIEGVPRYQRFWLGGDTLGPRVFETRSITPLRYVELDDQGRIVDVIGDPRFISPEDLVTSGGIPVLIEVGGDRYFLLQTELAYPLNEQAELALFLDAGDTLFEDQSVNFDTMRVSAGVELRFHLPIFPVPLRLIYGFPVREVEGDRSSNFTFSIGRSF